jgi:hypothetical protein
MSIETTVADMVKNTEDAVTEALQLGQARLMMDAISSRFGSVPIGNTVLILADLLGRLAVECGGDERMELARRLCTLVLLRAQKGRG